MSLNLLVLHAALLEKKKAYLKYKINFVEICIDLNLIMTSERHIVG